MIDEAKLPKTDKTIGRIGERSSELKRSHYLERTTTIAQNCVVLKSIKKYTLIKD